MYTDIPEWSDYAKRWGTALLIVLASAGIIGGLIYMIKIL
jgi:hypothetical protein